MPSHVLYLIVADSAYYVRHMLREIEIFVSCNSQKFMLWTKLIILLPRHIHAVTQPHGDKSVMVNC